MAANQSNGSNKPLLNLRVSGSKKRLYEASKEPKDGFQKVEYGEGSITYHKYYNSVDGNIVYAAFQESEYGNRLSLIVSDGEESCAVGLPVGSREFNAFLENAFNVDFSRHIDFGFYPGKSQTSDKEYLNCSIRYKDTDEVERPERLNLDDRPAPVKRKTGKWDFSEFDEWMFERMEEFVDRFKTFKESGSAYKELSAKPKSDSNPPVNDEDEDDDDVPF